MTQDFSPDFAETFHFLDRRLQDVAELGSGINQVGSIASVISLVITDWLPQCLTLYSCALICCFWREAFLSWYVMLRTLAMLCLAIFLLYHSIFFVILL